MDFPMLTAIEGDLISARQLQATYTELLEQYKQLMLDFDALAAKYQELSGNYTRDDEVLAAMTQVPGYDDTDTQLPRRVFQRVYRRDKLAAVPAVDSQPWFSRLF